MDLNALEDTLKTHIADVPDFPKEGILFRDITPILQDPALLKKTIDGLAALLKANTIDFDLIAATESRGFIFGTALGYALGKGVVLVRKPGKLPRKTESFSYELEYGHDTLEVHSDAFQPGQRVLVVDDLLATGGTAHATGELAKRLGAEIVAYLFVIELSFLQGRAKLDAPTLRLVEY